MWPIVFPCMCKDHVSFHLLPNKNVIINHDRTWTCNPQILVPYPLGHMISMLHRDETLINISLAFQSMFQYHNKIVGQDLWTLTLVAYFKIEVFHCWPIEIFLHVQGSSWLLPNKNVIINHDRTRTCNPQIRSLVLYTLGNMVSLLQMDETFFYILKVFSSTLQ